MATRKQNEHEYPFWENLPDGGRRYWKVRRGKISGSQRITKIVDTNEMTLSLYQEVYNDDGKLTGLHHKYPKDLGHQDL